MHWTLLHSNHSVCVGGWVGGICVMWYMCDVLHRMKVCDVVRVCVVYVCDVVHHMMVCVMWYT